MSNMKSVMRNNFNPLEDPEHTVRKACSCPQKAEYPLDKKRPPQCPVYDAIDSPLSCTMQLESSFASLAYVYGTKKCDICSRAKQITTIADLFGPLLDSRA